MINKMTSRIAVSIAVVALVSGCASSGVAQKSEDPVAAKLDTYLLEDGAVRHEVTDQNVASLWQEYDALRRAGDLTAAKGKLQQAIAITPSDAALWSGAAEIELEENSHLRAENYAAKSNFLATVGNRPLRYRNWLIIQRAREGRGDLLGAREAEIESSKLQ